MFLKLMMEFDGRLIQNVQISLPVKEVEMIVLSPPVVNFVSLMCWLNVEFLREGKCLRLAR